MYRNLRLLNSLFFPTKKITTISIYILFVSVTMETIYYHFLMAFSFHSLIQYMSSDRCKWSVDPFDKISDWNSKQLMYFKICLWETPGLVLKVFCLNQLGKWEFFWPLGTRSRSIEKSRQNIICIVSCFQWILAHSVMSLCVRFLNKLRCFRCVFFVFLIVLLPSECTTLDNAIRLRLKKPFL